MRPGGWVGAARRRWRGLEPRERRTLALGALALLAVMALAGWLELHEARLRAVAALREQRNLQAWLERAAAEASRLREAGGGAHAAAAPASPAAAMARAEAAARAAGIAAGVRALRPAGGEALEARLEDVAYAGLLRWLARLEAEGLDVRRLSLARRAPGRVDGTVFLAFRPPN